MSDPLATSTGARAVVISGASTGIGRSCALHLDRLGFHVFAGVRRAADGTTLAQVASRRLTPIVVDITDPDAVAAAAQVVFERNVGLTGLVNNTVSTVRSPLEYVSGAARPRARRRAAAQVHHAAENHLIRCLPPQQRDTTSTPVSGGPPDHVMANTRT